MDIRTILKNLKIEELNAMRFRKDIGISHSACADTEEGCRGGAGRGACSVARTGIADRAGL